MSQSIRVSRRSELRFVHRSIGPESASIYPRLRIGFEITHNMSPVDESCIMALMNMEAEFSIVSKEGAKTYIGKASSKEAFWRIYANDQASPSFYLDLDHYGLNQIEKLREGSDLRLEANIGFLAEVPEMPGEPPARSSHSIAVSFDIPKSNWVEKILPQLKYKDVALLEIPRLKDTEFADVVKYVDAAWKYYSMGEFSQVLGECRKALETLTTKVKDTGLKKEITDAGEKKTVPDWSKLLHNDEIGEIVGSICQKTFGFVVPGSHAGKSINREDADLALMITHAIVNFASAKLLQLS